MADWQSLLLDTNMLFAYIRDREAKVSSRIKSTFRAGLKIPLPEVVFYETMRGYNAIKDKKERETAIGKFERFIASNCELFGLSHAGWTHASEIWGYLKRQGIETDYGDILVMATAREYKRKVVTRNFKDFAPVMGEEKLEKW
jgi:predicted nucleic acid-binding protein